MMPMGIAPLAENLESGWPFVEPTPARTSRNRPRGAMVTKTVSCTKARYCEMLIERVIPAIRGRWPDREREVIIQQDGASAHIAADDPEFRLHAEAGLWRIRLLTQPPKSPDLNVLDLSFFRALQAAQWRSGVENTVDGLIRQVRRAYEEFDSRKLLLDS